MPINDELLKALLQETGIAGGQAKPFGGGKYNESYLVEVGKERYVLRIAPPDHVPQLFYEKSMMRSEPALHQLIREQTDVPVPEVIYHDFSRKLVDRDYIILAFMDGEPGPFDHAEMGRYVRQLHNLKGSRFGYPDRDAVMGDSWPTLFGEYVRLIFEDCNLCGILNEEEKDNFLTVYKAHHEVIQECSPRMLHLDLWSQNILTKNGKITAILDFDRGLYGDPELEFAVLDTYGYSTAGFFMGYGQPRLVNEKARIRQKLYIVYELIKYAFIRYARNGSYSTGRMHVDQCRDMLFNKM